MQFALLLLYYRSYTITNASTITTIVSTTTSIVNGGIRGQFMVLRATPERP